MQKTVVLHCCNHCCNLEDQHVRNCAQMSLKRRFYSLQLLPSNVPMSIENPFLKCTKKALSCQFGNICKRARPHHSHEIKINLVFAQWELQQQGPLQHLQDCLLLQHSRAHPSAFQLPVDFRPNAS